MLTIRGWRVKSKDRVQKMSVGLSKIFDFFVVTVDVIPLWMPGLF